MATAIPKYEIPSSFVDDVMSRVFRTQSTMIPSMSEEGWDEIWCAVQHEAIYGGPREAVRLARKIGASFDND